MVRLDLFQKDGAEVQKSGLFVTNQRKIEIISSLKLPIFLDILDKNEGRVPLPTPSLATALSIHGDDFTTLHTEMLGVFTNTLK